MLKHVAIKNYKSIGRATVDLDRLTVLVGPNGSGKSNFVDAISFVTDSLTEGFVDRAFRLRGGIAAVRRKSGGHPTHIQIQLRMNLPDGSDGEYGFAIAAERVERFRLAREWCRVEVPMVGTHVFEVRNGKFVREVKGIRPRIEPDRLALLVVSALPEFKAVYDFLTRMRFYSITPSSLRELQEADPGEFLKPDGSNAAAVLRQLQHRNDEAYRRLCGILSNVVQGLQEVEYRAVRQKETIRFKQDVGQKHPWNFDALNMSDGTLRVLGLLLAVYQPNRPSLVAIEEPEATVHPAVAEVVMSVLMDGARDTQVLVTTHSPDILDHKELRDTQIRVVTAMQGNTRIRPLGAAPRDLIRQRLYTPGELLRADELLPDSDDDRSADADQLIPFPAQEHQ